MKWNADVNEETLWLESRWEHWRRQLKRGLMVLFVCCLVAFLTLHPTGQRMVVTGQALGQAVGQFVEKQFVHFFGPDLLLRQRAAWASAMLKTELTKLHAMQLAFTPELEARQSELPALLAAQATATQAMQALTAQAQLVHAPTATVVSTHAFQSSSQTVSRSQLAAQVMAYSDLREQVSRNQQAVRVLEATLVQIRALQLEAQQQLIALDTTLALFNRLWQKQAGSQGEPALTTGEQLALRTALQIEISQAQALQQARRALEAALADLNLPVAQPTPDLRNRMGAAQGK